MCKMQISKKCINLCSANVLREKKNRSTRKIKSKSRHCPELEQKDCIGFPNSDLLL